MKLFNKSHNTTSSTAAEARKTDVENETPEKGNKSSSPRARHLRTASSESISSLLFTRNINGYNFIKASLRVSNRPFFPSEEQERAALYEQSSSRSVIPFGKTVEEVYDGVHDGPVLGTGLAGKIRKIKHKETSEYFALKCLQLSKLKQSPEAAQQLFDEIQIMCELEHPNIIRLQEVYESEDDIYLVEELCTGGELFDKLDEQPDYHYTEEKCADLIAKMLKALNYLHSQGIVHRDLKLENFLFSDQTEESNLKMIDFGLSKHFQFGEVHHEAVGTPYTVAPEVIKGSYDERCDIWAIGVIAYLLLSGDPPFGGCGGPETLIQVRRNILSGAFRFEPSEIWDYVSEEAKEFIMTLLQVEPSERPTAKEILRTSPWLHKWHQGFGKEDNDDCWLNCQVFRSATSDLLNAINK
mmetsp:Transcript_22324/g.25383  ORF Transcript_22324/g.25383 Transcript_22324/m.25383 type:complete len:412 (-) Transcript_22324:1774-3009(-)